MKTNFIIFLGLLFCGVAFCPLKARSQTAIVQTAVHFYVSIPLKDMKPAKTPFWKKWERENEKEIPNKFWPVPPGFIPDGALQTLYNNDSRAVTGNPIINFDGTTNATNVGRYTPPDPAGDVGPNHYVQVVNCQLHIFSKTGASLYGPVKTSTLWNGFPGNWTGHNNGDAIVLYDENADRWIISQFAVDCPGSPKTEYEMVAVSKTGDPLGQYYCYAFEFDYMPDYPKLGVWQDGYYLAVNRFNTNIAGNPFIGVGACVLERSKMLTGDPGARMVWFKTETLGGSCQCMLPSDCDGTFPAAGTPNYFAYINGLAQLKLWALHADWTTTTNSTFTNVTALPVAAYTEMGQASVPEQGGPTLDGLGDRLMFRNQYRNFGSYETFVTCHSVNVGGGVAGIRWYEYRKTGSTFSLYQQSTYAPPDGKSRWMGSIAMNSIGDIGMAYSVSSSTMYPSIYFTGRKAADPLNQMTIAEGIIQTGTTSMNTAYHRWGDYSALNIDPTDNLTFWTTQEYVGTYGGTLPWATKIASFMFPIPPTVNTTAATSVNGTSATLNGTVNPNGLSTSYYFQWGPSTTYLYQSPAIPVSVGSGTVSINVSANLTGLTVGQFYHFRLVGYSSAGYSYGDDLIFGCVNGIDLWAQDTPDEMGDEPNTISGGDLSITEDIWVTNYDWDHSIWPNNHQNHMNPEYQSDLLKHDYVNVQIRNRGCQPSAATGNTVTLYWAKASLSLSYPDPWMGGIYYPDPTNPNLPNVLMGDVIGTITIPAIQPGESVYLHHEWNPRNPADYATAFGTDQHHFCLLARIEPGITYPEIYPLWTNVANNNNIVWKNVEVFDNDQKKGGFLVGNNFNFPSTKKLLFTTPGNEGTYSILDLATVKIKLQDSLYRIWAAGGKQGDKIVELSDSSLKVTGSGAYITNLNLGPNLIYGISIDFKRDSVTPDSLPILTEFKILDVKQYTLDSNEGFEGAVRFFINQCFLDPVTISLTSVNASCKGTEDGKINLILSGGMAPYTYAWSNGDTTQNIEGLQAGTYIVTVTSAYGCTSTASQTVIENPPLPVSVVAAASANPITSGTQVTFIAAPVNGGPNPDFQWKINGSNAGTNSSTFVTSSLANHDVVKVVMTSGENCTTGNPATSNSITMIVYGLGIQESNTTTSNIKIYSEGKIVYVDIPDEIQGEITIFNIIGQKIKSVPACGRQLNRINLERGEGCFIVQVKSKTEVVAGKVFIQ